MGRAVVRAAATAAVLLVLAGCGGGAVSCGACPGPLWLTVRRAASAGPTPSAPDVASPTGSRSPRGPQIPASSRAAPGSVRVCVAGLPCEEKEWSEGDTVYLHPPRELRPSDLDGRIVEVTIHDPSGALTGTGTLRYKDGGTEPCSCSYSTAEVEVDR